MIIESLIAHIVGYFYFSGYPQEKYDLGAGNEKIDARRSFYGWGLFASGIVIAGLNRTGRLLGWLALILSLALGERIFYYWLERPLRHWLKQLTQDGRPAAQVFHRHRPVILLAVHQILFILWILLLNNLLFSHQTYLGQALILMLSVLALSGLSIRDNRFNKEQIKENLLMASGYTVISGIVLFISLMLIDHLPPVQLVPDQFHSLRTVEAYVILMRLALIILILMRPANLLIRLVSTPYDPKRDRAFSESEQVPVSKDMTTDHQTSGFEGAGAMIGNLERILIFLSFLYGSLLSVVAILSIKAFARYKLIADDPYFSEYFVIGTMLSVLITFITFAGLTTV